MARSRSLPSLATLRKAFAVLHCLAAHEDVGVSELAKELSLPGSTVHRFLGALTSLGYVLQDPATQRYRLSTQVLQLSGPVLSRLSVRKAARPYMERLFAEWDETINLGVLEGNRIVYVDRIQTTEPLRIENPIGDALEPYCSAIGKVVSAHLPSRELPKVLPKGRFRRFTGKTITDRRSLLRHFERVQSQGYALDDEEHYQGIRSVAAPIRNESGAVVGGVSLSAPTVRWTEERLPQVVSAVMKAAEEISRELGFRSQ